MEGRGAPSRSLPPPDAGVMGKMEERESAVLREASRTVSVHFAG
jgi:hypothetical protein